MAKLTWDDDNKHFYETGVSNCALYVMGSDGSYQTGVAWNGISSIEEAPEGADANAIYADNIKYLNLIAAEDFKATVEAYTYPDEFEVCDGSASIEGATIGQQKRSTFGLAYKTKVGNEDDSDLGYKIHIIYGCTAAPSSKSYETVNDSPEAISFSWEISTVPVTFTYDGVAYTTATIVVDSRNFTGTKATQLAAFEEQLFGGTSTEPTLLSPDKMLALLKSA